MHGSISYTFKYAQRFCSAYNIRICILHGVFGIWLGVRPRSSTRSTKLCCCSISFCFLALLQSLEIVCFLFRLGLAGIGFFFLFRFISLPTIECEESSCHQCNAKEAMSAREGHERRVIFATDYLLIWLMQNTRKLSFALAMAFFVV